MKFGTRSFELIMRKSILVSEWESNPCVVKGIHGDKRQCLECNRKGSRDRAGI